ncbi:MAG: TonB-dependent receptor plug domain-containing protein [Deltaproteobacteria bacterium]
MAGSLASGRPAAAQYSTTGDECLGLLLECLILTEGTLHHRIAIVAALVAAARSAAAAPAPTPAEAEGVEDTLTLLQAEEKTVTSNLRPETEDTAPAVVTVIDHREIAAMGARTLLDVLRRVTGMDVGRTPLGDDQLTLRGQTNPAELLVLIDGQRINNPYNGYAPVDLPVAMIDRVEVVRGPGSALYGTDAFAGVIQVFTRQPVGVIALAQTGDSGGGPLQLDAQRYQVGAGDREGKLYFGGSVGQAYQGGSLLTIPSDYLTTQNPSPLPPKNSQSLAPGPLSDWRRQLTADARLVLSGGLIDGDELALVGRFYDETHGEYFGPLATYAPQGSIGLSQGEAQLSYKAPLGSLAKLSLRAYVDRQGIDDLIALTPPGYFSNPPDGYANGFFPNGQERTLSVATSTYGGEAQLGAELPFHNSATVGAQLERQLVTAFSAQQNFSASGDATAGFVPAPGATPLSGGVSRDILGVYVQDIFEPVPQLSATVGLRLDDYSDFGASWNPRASVVYRPIPSVWVKGLYATAFSAPTFQELYDNTNADLNGGYVGNSALGPERLQNAEVELGTSVPLSGGGLDLSGNVFHNGIEGQIVEVPIFGTQNPLENAANVSLWGLEAQLRLRVPGFSVFGNVSDLYDDQVTFQYQDAAVAIGPTVSELTDVPRILANVGASVGPYFGLTLTALGHYAYFRQNDQRTPLEAVHYWAVPAEADLDLVLSTQTFWSFFRAFVGVYNVTGTPLFDPTPFSQFAPNLPQMPRSLACALRVDY